MSDLSLIYLASPYTHEDPAIMAARASAVAKCAANMTKAGLHVFSPIAYTSTLTPHMPDRATDWSSWADACEDMISRCDSLCVCCIDGWQTSRGVTEEIIIAENHRKPIRYVDANGRPCKPMR